MFDQIVDASQQIMCLTQTINWTNILTHYYTFKMYR